MSVRTGTMGQDQQHTAVEQDNNPQTAVTARLLQEGLQPEEIAGIRVEHIDIERQQLHVFRRGGWRAVPVSRFCMQLLEKALRQTVMESYDPNGQRIGARRILPSGYLIRVTMPDYVGNEALILDESSVRLRAVYARLRRLGNDDAHTTLQAQEELAVDLVS